MDADRIATIQQHIKDASKQPDWAQAKANWYWGVPELCDALVAAQAENTSMHERGAASTAMLAAVKESRDRLASQVTDLTTQLEALTGTEHIVEVTEDGWGLQHPYSCRPHLLGCRVHQIVDLDGPLVDEVGIYTVVLTEDERGVTYVARLSLTEEPST